MAHPPFGMRDNPDVSLIQQAHRTRVNRRRDSLSVIDIGPRTQHAVYGTVYGDVGSVLGLQRYQRVDVQAAI